MAKPTVSTATDTSNIFDQPANPSLTPPYSHSDRSPSSPQMEVPDAWMTLDNWTDVNASQGMQGIGVGDWDLSLFESKLEKSIDARLGKFSGPSVQCLHTLNPAVSPLRADQQPRTPWPIHGRCHIRLLRFQRSTMLWKQTRSWPWNRTLTGAGRGMEAESTSAHR